MRKGNETKEFSKIFSYVFPGMKGSIPEKASWQFSMDDSDEVREVIIYTDDKVWASADVTLQSVKDALLTVINECEKWSL